MNKLRLEADESSAKAEEFQAKVKVLEQETLSKEQEITSLQHKNGILEAEVEKLEKQVSDLKKAADDGQQHGTQNETLTRRLQLLEEEAEEADKTLREANEKYDFPCQVSRSITGIVLTQIIIAGFGRQMSRPDISSGKSRLSRPSATTGSPSTRRWPRSTPRPRRSSRSSNWRLVTSKLAGPVLLFGAGREIGYGSAKRWVPVVSFSQTRVMCSGALRVVDLITPVC